MSIIEHPPDDGTTYNSTGTPGNIDTYLYKTTRIGAAIGGAIFGTTQAGTWLPIFSVQWIGRLLGFSAPSVAPVVGNGVVAGGSLVVGASAAPTASWAYRHVVYDRDPIFVYNPPFSFSQFSTYAAYIREFGVKLVG